MSDYVKSINFTAKDALASGESAKLIKGADFDTELSAVAVASATKYDSGDIASVEQAKAATDNTVLITPLRLDSWASNEAAILQDLQLLTVAGFSAADALLGWDTSAGAAIGFTAGTGLAFSTTSFGLSHLGIEALADPDADAFIMWDDSAGATAMMELASDSGLAFGAAPDIAIDISGISAAFTGGAAVDGADLFLIDDGAGGTNTKIAYQDFGIPVEEGGDFDGTTPASSIALTYANRFYKLNNASAITWTIPANATLAFPVGTTFVLWQEGAGQVTVAVTTDTLRSPNGAKSSNQYSTIQVTKVASTEWVVSGDSSA